MSKRWTVLVLALGYGRERLHRAAKRGCEDLGFETNIYSKAGYPADRSLHSHAACVKAIEQHDIVVAIVDSSEGGTFQSGRAPRSMVRELQARGILPRKSGELVPTILEVEVMTARAKRKPTLILMPKAVEREVYETKKKIRSGALKLKPRGACAPSSKMILKRRDWESHLAKHYELSKPHDPTLRQLAFIERLRKVGPNWVSYFNDGADLRAQLKSSLTDVMQQVVPRARMFIDQRLTTTRPLSTTDSLQDILDAGLIVQPPFSVVSGAPSRSKELINLPSTKLGLLAESLLNSESALVVGPPGVGKTTISLLALKELLSDTALDSQSLAPLYCQGRDLTTAPGKPDDLYRTLLGYLNERDPWSAKIPLPNLKWLLVLDGIDESPLDPGRLDKMLQDLPPPKTLLLTCRDVDFELRLSKLSQHVKKIIRLDLWKQSHVQKYVEGLRRIRRIDAADFIAERLAVGDLRADVISIPLWLSMLTYIAERPLVRSRPGMARKLTSEYALLKACFDAICDGEISRQRLRCSQTEPLNAAWARTAFELHVARRSGRRVPLAQLAAVLGKAQGSPLLRAVCSVLVIEPDGVAGFSHEVFREFWLAQYLVDRLSDATTDAGEIARLFSYQRSLVTNRILRTRIADEGTSAAVGKRLREAYFEAGSLLDRKDFARNQLVYLAGRIDKSAGTGDFLKLLWGNTQGPEVIRHSAAFAAIMNGDMEIESQYYDLLQRSNRDDQINRGYHLYYYGDQDVPEDKMPPVDDGSAPARYALQHLFRRLRRSEESNLNLRRIELLTIRRFLETRRSLPIPEREALSIVRRVRREIHRARVSTEFVDSVRSEVSLVMLQISHHPKLK